MALKVIGPLSKVDILVDWSPASNHENHILRASIAFKDRSITIYEEVHPEKKLGNYSVHQSFLKRLKQIIPEHVKPVVITDAGFRTEWFQLVLNMSWDFEGRVCNNMQYLLQGQTTWRKLSSLFECPMNTPQYIGKVLLTKSSKLSCEMYSYKEKIKTKLSTKKKKRRRGNSSKSEKRYRRQYLQPWILVTSLKHISAKSDTVVKRYTRRMKIEHEFRDTKDRKWGIGLNDTRTRDPKRLEILLLIGTIGILMLWLLGLATELKKLHYQFQANTTKNKRVISIIFLGLQVAHHLLTQINKNDLLNVFKYAHESENNFYGELC
jgi:hypothetical protein